MLISIITATYNRANTLPRLYNSLLVQKNTDFEWILVDDGSDDTTEELVNVWIKENKINLRYYKKVNEGKTRAVDFGFSQNPNGIFSFVLDSDDYLPNNALSIIENSLVNFSTEYIGIVGLKYDSNESLIGEKFKVHESSYIDIYFGKDAISGDKLFIIRTEIYKKSIVLPFAGEKFMPDNLPYIRANSLGKYKLVNECFYIGDYLEDGMTSNIYKMAILNIKGFTYEKRELQREKLISKFRIINNIKFIHYCILDKMKMKEIIEYSNDKFWTGILYIPVLILLYNKRKLYSNLK